MSLRGRATKRPASCRVRWRYRASAGYGPWHTVDRPGRWTYKHRRLFANLPTAEVRRIPRPDLHPQAYCALLLPFWLFAQGQVCPYPARHRHRETARRQSQAACTSWAFCRTGRYPWPSAQTGPLLREYSTAQMKNDILQPFYISLSLLQFFCLSTARAWRA